MGLKYKYHHKRQEEFQDAISLLLEKGLYSPAMQIMWTNIRELIFNYLEKRRIGFNSTHEAITILILSQESEENKKCIYYLYTCSIVNEWDAKVFIKKDDFDKFEHSYLIVKEIAVDGKK